MKRIEKAFKVLSTFRKPHISTQELLVSCNVGRGSHFYLPHITRIGLFNSKSSLVVIGPEPIYSPINIRYWVQSILIGNKHSRLDEKHLFKNNASFFKLA